MKKKLMSVGKPCVYPYYPEMSNERLQAQQGLFLLPSTIENKFEEILTLDKDIGNAFLKIIIPAKLRYEGLERLRRMNITTASLFPGLDCFCRSLKYQTLETSERLQLL